MKKDILLPLRKLHGYMYEKRLWRKERRAFFKSYIKPIRDRLKENPNALFLVLTPEHGNLGDHAIAVSEANLLSQANIEYIEITGKMLNEISRYNLLKFMNGHPIMINGGGNLGTLWFDVEKLQRNIIKNNPKSTIFIMPNTIFYEDSDWGNNEFKQSVRIYNRHKKLYLYAREPLSFEVMNAVYNNVKLIPDMVLALNESNEQTERSGCLLCLRADREKTIDEKSFNTIWQKATHIFGDDVKQTDMVIKGPIPISQREEALERRYSEFRSAKLVITDRLHGMIFCVITGTPCIVIDSKSPKVRGCYEWVKNLPYVKFVEDVSIIPKTYQEIPHRTFTYDSSVLSPYYDELKQEIVSILQGD